MKELIIKSIPIYNGKIIKVKRNLVLLQDNKLAFREIVEHQEAVCVIPILNDEIIFVKQFRSGANKLLLELPAGLIDSNETPLEAAKRELQEEIKYSSAKITYLGCYYSSPGFTNELIHLYICEELFESSLKEDSDEFIEVTKYNINQIKRLLKSNTITDMKTAFGLTMFLNIKMNQSN